MRHNVPRVCCELRGLAGVDLVGQGRDSRAFLLAIDILETSHGHGSGLDDVPEYGARADAGELVDVADQDHLHAGRASREQRPREADVDH